MKSDRRKSVDRRKEIISWPKDRRVRPDRRLNNISVEWIPFDEVKSHPITRDAFCSAHKEDKNMVHLRGKDRREEESSKQTQCDKKRSPINFSRINIFKRTQGSDVEQRTIHDRRSKNIELPYDRRVRPDRRLNNISIEWITFD